MRTLQSLRRSLRHFFFYLYKFCAFCRVCVNQVNTNRSPISYILKKKKKKKKGGIVVL